MTRTYRSLAGWIAAFLLLVSASRGEPSHGAVPGVIPVKPAGAADGLFGYRFEHGRLEFMDLITLEDGTFRLGKAMEWADQVLVFGAENRPSVFDARHVRRIDFRRYLRHREKPALPDLTVAFVERLPRDPHLHGFVHSADGVPRVDVNTDGVSWKPEPGQKVTFRIHVRNAGARPSASALARVSIDGSELVDIPVESIAPGEMRMLEASWPWSSDADRLRVELRSQGSTIEINQWNNTFEEPIQALGVAVVVARDFYDRFDTSRNLVDSFCFEDWVQYQLRSLNALFHQSAFHTQPEGILERVRCDRILIVDDPNDPDQPAHWRAELRRGGLADGLAEYAAVLVFGNTVADASADHPSLNVDWPSLKSLCLQLGLVDLAKTDTRPEQCLAVNSRRLYVNRQHLFPWPRTLMHTPGGFRLTEPEAAYLNRVRGRPRGLQGEYLYQLPEKITIVAHAGNGQPMADVQVDVFQLQSEGEYAGFIVGVAPGDPLYSAPTDALGRLTLLDQEAPDEDTPSGYRARPNPFGRIALDGGNGLLLLQLRSQGGESYQFLRLQECLTAYLQGQRDDYVVHLQTRFGLPDAPPAPVTTATYCEDRAQIQPPVSITWSSPPGFSVRKVDEFRIYRRTSLGGEEVAPWELVAVNRKLPEGWWLRYDGAYWQRPPVDAEYSGDTFFAVSCVDKNGRESSLAAPGYLAYGKDSVKMAIHRDYAVMTLIGDGPIQLLRWDGEIGTHPYGVRNLRFPGYRPAFAGIAVNSDHRLVMTDPVNHVIAFYDDMGELTEIVPHRDVWPGFASDKPGEFYTPWDIAVDAAGRIYVADYGNDRVQIFDASARYLGLLDEGFAFRGPHALAVANGHLCVTDREGRRCRVYDVSGEAPVFVRQLPPLLDADRGLVSQSGRIYITGRLAEKMENGILVFAPDGDRATYERVLFEVEMGKVHGPRGLYFFINALGHHYAYCVNSFPFDLRRQLLD